MSAVSLLSPRKSLASCGCWRVVGILPPQTKSGASKSCHLLARPLVIQRRVLGEAVDAPDIVTSRTSSVPRPRLDPRENHRRQSEYVFYGEWFFAGSERRTATPIGDEGWNETYEREFQSTPITDVEEDDFDISLGGSERRCPQKVKRSTHGDQSSYWICMTSCGSHARSVLQGKPH